MKEENKNQKEERKLTKAEERRKEKFEIIRKEMLSKGYKETDLTITVLYANVMAIVTAIPFAILFGLLFYFTGHSFDLNIGTMGSFLIAISFLVSIVMHEGIHGLFWGIFAKNHFKDIEFGFIAEYLTPYCTCKSPLNKVQYIIGGIMPTVILGIIPCIVAVCIGYAPVLYFGLIMIWAGGGDMTILLNILKNKFKGKEVLFLDHPYECGTVVFEK